jgi:hypothetical protein
MTFSTSQNSKNIKNGYIHFSSKNVAIAPLQALLFLNKNFEMATFSSISKVAIVAYLNFG